MQVVSGPGTLCSTLSYSVPGPIIIGQCKATTKVFKYCYHWFFSFLTIFGQLLLACRKLSLGFHCVSIVVAFVFIGYPQGLS